MVHTLDDIAGGSNGMLSGVIETDREFVKPSRLGQRAAAHMPAEKSYNHKGPISPRTAELAGKIIDGTYFTNTDRDTYLSVARLQENYTDLDRKIASGEKSKGLLKLSQMFQLLAQKPSEGRTKKLTELYRDIEGKSLFGVASFDVQVKSVMYSALATEAQLNIGFAADRPYVEGVKSSQMQSEHKVGYTIQRK